VFIICFSVWHIWVAVQTTRIHSDHCVVFIHIFLLVFGQIRVLLVVGSVWIVFSQFPALVIVTIDPDFSVLAPCIARKSLFCEFA